MSPQERKLCEASEKTNKNQKLVNIAIPQKYDGKLSAEHEKLLLGAYGIPKQNLTAAKLSSSDNLIRVPYFRGDDCVGVSTINSNNLQHDYESNSYDTFYRAPSLASSRVNYCVVVNNELEAIRIAHLFPNVWALRRPFKLMERELGRFDQVINLTNYNIGKKVELPFDPDDIGTFVYDYLETHTEQELVDFIKLKVKRPSLMTSAEFLAYAEELEREDSTIIEGLFKRGEIMAIAGKAKNYKTIFLFNLLRTLLDPSHDCIGYKATAPNKVLLIEEEMTATDLKSMAIGALKGEWKDQLFWRYKTGFKFDNELSLKSLRRQMILLRPDVVVFDSFQRMHNAESEDKASDLAYVWDNIFDLMIEFPKASFILLFHFGKSNVAEEGLMGIRGTSRTAGEVDVGIFTEKRKDGKCKLYIEGRAIKGFDKPKILNFDITDYSLSEKEAMTEVDKMVEFEKLIKAQGSVKTLDLAGRFRVTERTIRNWASQCGFIADKGWIKKSL